jgi:hypothetical protein
MLENNLLSPRLAKAGKLTSQFNMLSDTQKRFLEDFAGANKGI